MGVQIKVGSSIVPVTSVQVKLGGVYQAVTNAFVKSGGAYVSALTPPPIQSVVTQNRTMSSAETRTGKTRVFFRWPIVFACDVTSVIYSFNNWYSSNAGEVAVANGYSIEACSLEIGSEVTPITFSGGRTKALLSGESDIQSDEVAIAVSKGTAGWVKGIVSVPVSGNLIPFCARVTTDVAGSQAAWYDPAVTTPSSVDVPGEFTVTGTAAETRVTTVCPIVLGRPTASTISFIAVGDSIGEGAGDSSAAGIHGKGFVQRAMHAAGSDTQDLYPCMNFCRTGNDTPDSIGANTRWREFIQYATHAIEEYGTNDLGSSGTGDVTTIQNNISTLWGILRTGGIQKIIRSELMPRTSSASTNWISEADQTVNTNWGAGEKSEQMNAWFASQIGSGVDYVVTSSLVRDPTVPQKWITNGTNDYPTADGTHPAPATSEFAAVALRSVIASL